MTITCRACECKQEPADKCRRCGKKLWGPTLPAIKPMPIIVRHPEILTLQQLEKRAITDACALYGPKEAAKLLGITRQAMWLKRRAYGLLSAKERKEGQEKISTDIT